MTLKSFNLDKKPLLSFVTFIVGLVSGLITVFTPFVQDKGVNLECRVESMTNVLDVNEEVDGLQVIYRMNDIMKLDKNLSIVRMRILNESSINLIKGSYDSQIPFGIYFEGAEVLKDAEIVEASNVYLEENFKATRIGSDSLEFSQLIFDGGEYVLIDILILHDKELTPFIGVMGKIAGMKEIQLLMDGEGMEIGPWQVSIAGSLNIQLIRVLVYTFGGTLGLTLAFFIFWILFEVVFRLNRKRITRVYRLRKEIKSGPEIDLVFYYYISEGRKYIKRISEVFDHMTKDSDYLSVAYNGQVLVPTKNCSEDDIEMFEELSRKNILTYDQEKNQIFINKDFWDGLRDLKSYLNLV